MEREKAGVSCVNAARKANRNDVSVIRKGVRVGVFDTGSRSKVKQRTVVTTERKASESVMCGLPLPGDPAILQKDS